MEVNNSVHPNPEINISFVFQIPTFDKIQNVEKFKDFVKKLKEDSGIADFNLVIEENISSQLTINFKNVRKTMFNLLILSFLNEKYSDAGTDFRTFLTNLESRVEWLVRWMFEDNSKQAWLFINQEHHNLKITITETEYGASLEDKDRY